MIFFKKRMISKCSFILVNHFFYCFFFFLISLKQIDLVFFTRLSSASGKSIKFVLCVCVCLLLLLMF